MKLLYYAHSNYYHAMRTNKCASHVYVHIYKTPVTGFSNRHIEVCAMRKSNTKLNTIKFKFRTWKFYNTFSYGNAMAIKLVPLSNTCHYALHNMQTQVFVQQRCEDYKSINYSLKLTKGW